MANYIYIYNILFKQNCCSNLSDLTNITLITQFHTVFSVLHACEECHLSTINKEICHGLNNHRPITQSD